jgi:glutathione S-transferase
MKLYGAPLTRSSFVQWYLEEIGVSYEYVALNYHYGTFYHPPADFLEVNPFGKTPALIDGDFTLWESGAILLYLAEKYDRLPISLEKRAKITQWLFFGTATLDPFILVPPTTFQVEQRSEKLPRFLQPIEAILQQQAFLTGDKFTVADIVLGFNLLYLKFILRFNFTLYPDIDAYFETLQARSAFKKTLGEQMQLLFTSAL